MPIPISTALYTDPACPWGYSASPALRVLGWLYGARLDWRLAVIGLTESADQYVARGFTPLRMARGSASFRRPGNATILEALDSPAVTEAYERNRKEARSAAGTAAERQDKTA